MDEIKLTKENVDKAYAIADDSTKKVLDALLGRTATPTPQKPTPTLDDYKTITTYEDACVALGISPLLNDATEIYLGNDNNGRGYATTNLPSHIIALLKLETISRALWGRSFVPKPDANGSEYYFYPWFYLYTQNEIDNMDDEEKEGVLSFGSAGSGAYAGFGFTDTHYRSSYSYAAVGFRLCQENQEKARYFGIKFKELWAEYLLSNICGESEYLLTNKVTE